MKDRYLYKAKRADNGEWVHGYYAVIGGREVIIKSREEKYYTVDEGKNASGNEIVPIRAATICQCTGLRDKTNTLIWENDIVRLPAEEDFLIICWDENDAKFCLENNYTTTDFDNYWFWETEVIGDKFDNPELLGEE